jgi:Rrf2 family iron-sulfur cluster assembly transcriptional regulator
MIPKRATNALRIVVFIAGMPAQQTVSTCRLSQTLDLSVSYLESLLSELKTHGLLHAFKGPGGGYQLGVEPQDMSVWDVLQIFAVRPDAKRKNASSGGHYLDTLEQEFEVRQCAFLRSQSIAQLLQGAGPSAAPALKAAGQFRLKPMPPKLMPHTANSVFQLPSFPSLRAA